MGSMGARVPSGALGLFAVVSGLVITHVTGLDANESVERPASTRIAELRRENLALASRVAMLEEAFASLSSSRTQVPNHVSAPFEVVDAAGNPLLLVTGDPSSSVKKKARVTIARASGDNFQVSVRNKSGNAVAAMGEGKAGAGVVSASDPEGEYHAALVGDRGLVIYGLETGKEIANVVLDPDNKGRALFRVDGGLRTLDGAGKPIFTVTDVPQAKTAGRVFLGPAANGNYGMWIRNQSGEVAAAMGEAKSGGGVVSVYDPSGRPRADLFGQGGVAVYNTSGKEVVSLNLKSDNTESGLLELRGLFQIFDAGGQAMVEAGTSPKGVGVVRVGPAAGCVPLGPLRVPDCIMGRRSP